MSFFLGEYTAQFVRCPNTIWYRNNSDLSTPRSQETLHREYINPLMAMARDIRYTSPVEGLVIGEIKAPQPRQPQENWDRLTESIKDPATLAIFEEGFELINAQEKAEDGVEVFDKWNPVKKDIYLLTVRWILDSAFPFFPIQEVSHVLLQFGSRAHLDLIKSKELTKKPKMMEKTSLKLPEVRAVVSILDNAVLVQNAEEAVTSMFKEEGFDPC